MVQCILGSQSPRRKEILSFFNIPFDQAVPPFIEEAVPFTGDPSEYVCTLSNGKAESLSRLHREAIMITADTIVYHDGKVYGKPVNQTKAIQALEELSGKWHSVFTGVTVRKGEQIFFQAEESKVLLNTISPSQLHSYVTRLNCMDKAGGYAVQMGGSIIVKKIDGCFYNVMGLPVNTLCALLKKVGVDLWHHVKD